MVAPAIFVTVVCAVGDKLLLKKKHHELLEPYDARRAAAIGYMQSVRPSLDISGGPLTDPQVPVPFEMNFHLYSWFVDHMGCRAHCTNLVKA